MSLQFLQRKGVGAFNAAEVAIKIEFAVAIIVDAGVAKIVAEVGEKSVQIRGSTGLSSEVWRIRLWPV
jgi:hypothetical protein